MSTGQDDNALTYGVLDAVKYRFETELKKKLMAVAESEVDAAVDVLTQEIDWEAALNRRLDTMGLELFVKITDMRKPKDSDDG